MEGRILTANPVTQSIDGVRALLSWRGHPVSPMPADVSLDNGRMVLVLSNKKDAYYTCTSAKCSCPSATYHPGQKCKHQRKFFPQQETAKSVSDDEPLIKRGGFKPFSLLPSEEKAVTEAAQ